MSKLETSTQTSTGAEQLSVSAEADLVTGSIAQQAAEWFFRLQAPDVSPMERKEWEHWCAADTRHALAWQRAMRIGAKLDSLPPQLAITTLTRHPDANRRLALKTFALLIVSGSAGLQAWRSEPVRRVMAAYHTATGERRSIILADGTRVQLNTASAIDIVFDDKKRLLKLQAGEILIETAPDAVRSDHAAYRPFMVETAQGVLRALGTRFVVRQESEHTRLAVLEGAVEVRPSSAAESPFIVQAGWQTRFTSGRVAQVDVLDRHVDGWSHGVLYANAMRLDQFIAELGRYRPGILRCDSAVADLRISGVFQLDNTDPVLNSLSEALPVRLIYRTRYWVTILAN
ncbi:FecR domain-containing protein [Methylophilus sp. OH31]|uniref:FecR domain-containing protein n=1 Tax=Methylophilus sp. OH31 TaxID=1387312 RepID=UPI000464A06C|nr:FecR domain-containing protein [Methylophilus sp. OH31]